MEPAAIPATRKVQAMPRHLQACASVSLPQCNMACHARRQLDAAPSVPHTCSLAWATRATTLNKTVFRPTLGKAFAQSTKEQTSLYTSKSPNLGYAVSTTTVRSTYRRFSAASTMRRPHRKNHASRSTPRSVATQGPPTPSTCPTLAWVMSFPRHSSLMPPPMSPAYALEEATEACDETRRPERGVGD